MGTAASSVLLKLEGGGVKVKGEAEEKYYFEIPSSYKGL